MLEFIQERSCKMNNKEYLNEVQYQKANKKVKKTGMIVLTIGLVMLISGIVSVIIGSANKTTGLIALGAPFIVLGIGITIWGCMIRFLIGNQRQISAYMAQQQMPIAKEGIEKIAPSAGVAAKEIAKGVKEGLKDDEE